MLTVALGAFGTLIGSFLNVVVYRVPTGRSIVSPPSACGSCGHPVRRRDNIPILSWLVLGARCRDCSSPISARYPLVEFGTAVLFVLVALRFLPAVIESQGIAFVGSIVALVAYLYLAAISVALALIDVDTHRLPNVIVLPAYIVGAVLLTVSAALTGEWWRLAVAVAGLAILFLFYATVVFVRPGGMGMGDVKLAGVLGMFLGALGWDVLAVGVLAGFILGGLFGVVLIALGKSRKVKVAFGPWMLLGAWVGILAGEPIAHWYLGILGVA